MKFIKNKIDDKINMEPEACKQNLILIDDAGAVNQELAVKMEQIKYKDITFFEQIYAESLALKQSNAEATQRKLFAEKIINYLKAQKSIIFNSTEMQILDILKEYKDFVSVEIITNNIINRILISNTDSVNEWNQIILEKPNLEYLLDDFVFSDLNLDEGDHEIIDTFFNEKPDTENNKDILSNDQVETNYSRANSQEEASNLIGNTLTSIWLSDLINTDDNLTNTMDI